MSAFSSTFFITYYVSDMPADSLPIYTTLQRSINATFVSAISSSNSSTFFTTDI